MILLGIASYMTWRDHLTLYYNDIITRAIARVIVAGGHDILIDGHLAHADMMLSPTENLKSGEKL
jgi:hypothetical protein